MCLCVCATVALVINESAGSGVVANHGRCVSLFVEAECEMLKSASRLCDEVWSLHWRTQQQPTFHSRVRHRCDMSTLVMATVSNDGKKKKRAQMKEGGMCVCVCGKYGTTDRYTAGFCMRDGRTKTRPGINSSVQLGGCRYGRGKYDR